MLESDWSQAMSPKKLSSCDGDMFSYGFVCKFSFHMYITRMNYTVIRLSLGITYIEHADKFGVPLLNHTHIICMIID